MTPVHVRFLVRALVFLTLFASLDAQAPPSAGSARATDYSTEAFIVEEIRSVYRFENDGTGRRENYLRVKTQSEAGVQAWGQLVFGYNAASERLDVQFVRVHKLDGAVVTAPADAIQDLSSPVERVAPVYTDFRQKHITVPSFRPGETLEVSVLTTVHTALAPGQFWMEHDFRTEGVILDEQLDIDVPRERKVILKTRDGADPVTKEDGGRRLYRWTSSHREASNTKKDDEKKSGTKPDEPQHPAVRLTTFQNWDEVGRWYASLEKSSRAPTPDIRKKALELTSGKTTAMAKLEALYDFVAPNFRYVSLSLGMGRYQPRPAADVLRDQYGDCKDKHTLLASLAESLGMPVSTVLINSSRKVDAAFPSPSQFDHAITRATAGSEEVWLDVTTEVAPFRLLSPNLRKKQALVVSAGSPAHLEETPADPPMPNSQVVDVNGTLAELGRLSGRVRVAVRGDLELFMRLLFRRTPAAQWKELIDEINSSAGLGGEVSDWKVSDPADTRSIFAIDYQVSRAPLVDWTKKKVDLKLPLASIGLPDRGETDADGKSPIELGSPMTSEYTLKLQLSPDYKARAPLPVAIARDYGEYRATYSLAENTFSAVRLLQLRGKEIAADRTGDYRAFARVVTADAAQVLALEVAAAATVAPPADLKVDELYRSGYDALANGNNDQAVALLKRVVELEPNHKGAWNNLGLAYLNLRQLDNAIESFKKQLGVNAYDEYANNNLGRVYLQQRKYADAEAALRKQVEINPLDKWAHGNLGRVYVETKRYAEAIAELEKAISLTPDDAYLHIEIGTAYLNRDKNDEAMAAFDRAASLASNPLTWNNVAYQLSLKGAHLDRAQQYAESAVSAVTAESRTFSADRVTARELRIVESMASYWDTLGWVFFAKGDLDRAEKLVAAAWRLGQSAEVGDHLAQIYEKRGRRDDALRAYALALNADRPIEDTRNRLMALAGSTAKGEDAIREQADGLARMRSFPLEGHALPAGKAEFVLLFGAGSAVEQAVFVAGDDGLRPAANVLKTASYGSVLPDETPAKILRRGALTCAAPAAGAKASSCTMTLTPVSQARPVQ
jgi:tetratricopeptide (TPR) repeat protein/transglutaminase-like putative cysteine protease